MPSRERLIPNCYFLFPKIDSDGLWHHDAGATGQTLVTGRNLITGSQVVLASRCTRLGQILGVQGQDKLALDTAARRVYATVKVKRRVNHQSQPQLGHHFTQSGTRGTEPTAKFVQQQQQLPHGKPKQIGQQIQQARATSAGWTAEQH
jgi:hypothetical protein